MTTARKVNRRIGGLMLFVLCIALLSLGVHVFADGNKYGGQLRYGYVSEIDTLDGHCSQTTVGRGITDIIWEPLVDWDQNLNLKPGLAESWEASDDGHSWTFHLRKGVKFHNGRELEARDVQATIKRLQNPKIGATYKTLFEHVKSVEIIDRYTVKFHLTRSDGAMPSKLCNGNAAGIMPYDLTPMDRRLSPEDKIIGTGPFKFVEWKKNDYIKLERFDNYWQEGLPYLDSVLLKPVPDPSVRLAALRAADLDVIEWISLEQIEKERQNPSKDYVVSVGPYGAETGYICMNNLEPPFNDVRVRQAVAYAIDKDQIVKGAWRGFGEPVNQAFSTSSEWYCPVEDRYRHADVEKAKALLAEAGYPKGFSVVWGATTGYQYMTQLAQVVQAQLRKVGIDVKLELYDWPSYATKMPKMEFKIWNTGVPGVADPVSWYPLTYKKGSAFHWIAGKYVNPDVDTLLDEAEKETNFDKRKALYCRVVEIIERDVPMIYTSTGSIGFGWRSKVKGFQPHTNACPHYSGGGIAYTWFAD